MKRCDEPSWPKITSEYKPSGWNLSVEGSYMAYDVTGIQSLRLTYSSVSIIDIESGASFSIFNPFKTTYII